MGKGNRDSPMALISNTYKYIVTFCCREEQRKKNIEVIEEWFFQINSVFVFFLSLHSRHLFHKFMRLI